MENVFINWIKDNFGVSFLIGLLFVAAFIYLIWWTCKIYHKIKKVDKLPCDKHSDKINQIDVVSAKLDGIIQAIQLISPNSEKRTIIQSYSPISLTPFGEELVRELKISDYLNGNWEVISNYIEHNSESLNPYDIQQLCFNYVLLNPSTVLTENGYDALKRKAYEIGLPAISILQGVSILIRDRYFEEHKINLNEIDAHSPNK